MIVLVFYYFVTGYRMFLYNFPVGQKNELKTVINTNKA